MGFGRAVKYNKTLRALWNALADCDAINVRPCVVFVKLAAAAASSAAAPTAAARETRSGSIKSRIGVQFSPMRRSCAPQRWA